jgi:hypothetical protein
VDHEEARLMPMIDVYAATGTFADEHQLVQAARAQLASGPVQTGN